MKPIRQQWAGCGLMSSIGGCKHPIGMRMLATAFFCIAFLAMAHVASAETSPPSAYDLLDRVRQHYRTLEDYGDRGTLEHCRAAACRHYVFETVSDGSGAFLWRLRDVEQDGEERVVWSDGATTQVYDQHRDQRKEIASPEVELALGLGQGGYEALVVAGLLAGDGSALEDPEGAAVDGPEACPRDTVSDAGGQDQGRQDHGGQDHVRQDHVRQGLERCWLLSLSRMAGSIESYLWIGVESSTIHRVETLHTPFSISGKPGVTTRLVVDHRLQGASDRQRAQFEVPASSQSVERFEARSRSTASAATTGEADVPVFGEGAIFVDEITVELFSLPVRIFDSFGEPLKNIQPVDLVADIGGREVPITHVDWVSPLTTAETTTESPGNAADHAEQTREAEAWADWYWEGKPSDRGPKPRLIVFFVQADFEPSRVRGHLRLLPLVRELIWSLQPQDRVALLTFDSHLRMWQDLTTDHQAVAETLYDAVRPGGHPVLREPRGPGPFLRPQFNVDEARRVANAETALGMTAEALVPLGGRKEIIFLGWGLGEYRAGAVHMTQDFGRAVDALYRAQATVSVLDVTEADWHALEFGLQSVAKATGGTYQRTLHFASQATQRLARQLKGYYVVYLDRQAAAEARGRVHVRLRKGPGEAVHANIVLGRK